MAALVVVVAVLARLLTHLLPRARYNNKSIGLENLMIGLERPFPVYREHIVGPIVVAFVVDVVGVVGVVIFDTS